MEHENNALVVAIDVGTTKIIVAVAKITQNDIIHIIGCYRSESSGMREGSVVDIASTVQSIRTAVEGAQKESDCEIKGISSIISGNHIEQKQSDGMVSIKDGEVTESDMGRVLEIARRVPMSPGKEVLHTLVQEFILDEEAGIQKPLGMRGMRLKANVHFITGGINATKNLIRCMDECDLQIENLYFQPLASATSVLYEDEQDLGVCLIDMGGGVSDFIVYKNQGVICSGVIPLAGVAITRKIAAELGISLTEAENIKRYHGKATVAQADPHVTFNINSHGTTKTINAQILASIIEPCVSYIFSQIHEKLKKAQVNNQIKSIVITGGSSLLFGTEALCENIFKCQARIGIPLIDDSSIADIVRKPDYAAAMGLLRLIQKDPHPIHEEESSLRNKVFQWFSNIFR